MSPKLPISACMLVMNEADRLEQSLAALSIFDEVLIYDSGSTDGSQQIAEKFNARIIQGPWHGFSKTRIQLFKEAKNEWILWVDADEVLTPELLKELQSTFQNKPTNAAFAINRMVYFEGHWIRHGDWFPDWNVRLFRSDSWQMEERAVHESLSIKGRIQKLQHLIEHHSYRNWEDQEKRSQRYAQLWAEDRIGKAVPWGMPTLRAGWKFFRAYILKQGCLDGVIGFKIATANAKEVRKKYTLLRLLNRDSRGATSR